MTRPATITPTRLPKPKPVHRFIEAKWSAGCVEFPVRLVSEANMRGNWRGGHSRSKQQRKAVKDGLSVVRAPALPCLVRITRIAPAMLDDDNAARSAKGCRDQVAAWLGVDDRDPRVLFVYAQERRAPRTYGIRIEWWTVTQAKINARRAAAGAGA